MAGRKPSPEYQKALDLFLDSDGTMPLIEIASRVGKSDGQIRKWKSEKGWDALLEKRSAKGNVTKSNSNVTKSDVPEERGTSPPGKGKGKGAPDRKRRDAKQTTSRGGAPEGNTNAVGHGAPPANQNAVTHGLYRKHLPASIQQLIEEVRGVPPLDVIYEMIYIDFAKIIEALKLMHVQSEEDHLHLIKKKKWSAGGQISGGRDDGKETGLISEIEYEVHVAPDLQANQMRALATVQAALRANIKMFMELSGKDDKRRLELQQMEASLEKTRAEIDKLKEGSGGGDRTQIIDDLGSDFNGGSD